MREAGAGTAHASTNTVLPAPKNHLCSSAGTALVVGSQMRRQSVVVDLEAVLPLEIGRLRKVAGSWGVFIMGFIGILRWVAFPSHLPLGTALQKVTLLDQLIKLSTFAYPWCLSFLSHYAYIYDSFRSLMLLLLDLFSSNLVLVANWNKRHKEENSFTIKYILLCMLNHLVWYCLLVLLGLLNAKIKNGCSTVWIYHFVY